MLILRLINKTNGVCFMNISTNDFSLCTWEFLRLSINDAMSTVLDHTTKSHTSNSILSTSSTKACRTTQRLEVLRPTLDAIIKSVVSGFSWAKVLAICVPSMLETNQTFGPPLEYGFRASVTISGPWQTQMWSTLFIHIVKVNYIRLTVAIRPAKCFSNNLVTVWWFSQSAPLTRSDPPMPMFTTSVMALPLKPFHTPLRTLCKNTQTC